MRVLAIDTSCAGCSVAIYDGDTRHVLACESQAMLRGHAEALPAMVQAVLTGVEGGVNSLGKVAVGVGPGSFTGIRIGLSMARAIAVSLEIPVVGVPTLVAFVGPLLDNPRPGVIASVIDARHGQVYFQLFESKGRQILAPRVATLRDAVRAIGSGPVRIVGDAAVALAEEALRAGAEADASEAVPYPDIVALARIGLAADPASWPPRPLYVKAPDAHPAQGYAVARVEG